MSTIKFSEKAVRLIEGKNFGFLAIVMKDGSPRVNPVWVDREGDLVLVNTAVGRIKLRVLKRNPNIAISVVNSSNPYERVLIVGTVVEQTATGAEEHIDKLAKKYQGAEKYTRQSPDEKRVILKIRPKLLSDK